MFSFTVPGSACSPVIPDVSAGNPIGRKTGASLPDEWIVVGAHYDARNATRCDGTQAPQPGANDNASGCAGVIELARVFQNVRTERSLVFMCFAGEEQGLRGSQAFVNALLNSGDIAKVKHMINLDMIGHAIDDTLSARVETDAAQQSILPIYADHAATYAPELNLIISASTAAYSDHWHFLQRGVPAAFTWENGAGIYPDYHQISDVPGNMQRAQPLASGILKMDAAMIATLAGVHVLFDDSFE
ncbi:MAG: M28 family peptidase [Ahniella sp.]|nr:M28 family peptidase [Ahniella sp.]